MQEIFEHAVVDAIRFERTCDVIGKKVQGHTITRIISPATDVYRIYFDESPELIFTDADNYYLEISPKGIRINAK